MLQGPPGYHERPLLSIIHLHVRFQTMWQSSKAGQRRTRIAGSTDGP